MKKILTALTIVVMTGTIAWAEWLVDFKRIYRETNIDAAVLMAVEEGITPDLIVENGMLLEGLNPANLVKALYCAGVQGQDIRVAGEKWGISEVMLAAGFDKSIAECADRLADAQAFTPVATGTGFVRFRRGGNDGDNVSVSGFGQ